METVSAEALPLMEYEPAGSHVCVEFHLEQRDFCFLIYTDVHVLLVYLVCKLHS